MKTKISQVYVFLGGVVLLLSACQPPETNLPKTGQTNCYSYYLFEPEIPCGTTGQDPGRIHAFL
jgi:hypothetical protein